MGTARHFIDYALVVLSHDRLLIVFDARMPHAVSIVAAKLKLSNTPRVGDLSLSVNVQRYKFTFGVNAPLYVCGIFTFCSGQYGCYIFYSVISSAVQLWTVGFKGDIL